MSLGPDDRIPVFEVSGPDERTCVLPYAALERIHHALAYGDPLKVGDSTMIEEQLRGPCRASPDCSMFDGHWPPCNKAASASPTPDERSCPSCGQWLLCMKCLHAPHVATCQSDTGDATGSYGECGCTFIASASPASNEDAPSRDAHERPDLGYETVGQSDAHPSPTADDALPFADYEIEQWRAYIGSMHRYVDADQRHDFARFLATIDALQGAQPAADLNTLAEEIADAIGNYTDLRTPIEPVEEIILTILKRHLTAASLPSAEQEK